MSGPKPAPTFEIETLKETSESLDQRVHRLLSAPDFMDEVYKSLCMGASLATVAETKNIPYFELSLFVNRDENKRKYGNALNMRRDFVVDKLTDEILKISVSDLRQLYKEDGTLKDVKDWPENIAGAIESIDVKELWEGKGKDREQVGTISRVKLWNKTKAIQLLGQEQGIFKEKVEHTADESLQELIMQSFNGEKKNESKQGQDVKRDKD